jgi:hypothetical protein
VKDKILTQGEQWSHNILPETNNLSFPNTGGTAVSRDTLSASLPRLMPLGEQARRKKTYILFSDDYSITSGITATTNQPGNLDDASCFC